MKPEKWFPGFQNIAFLTFNVLYRYREAVVGQEQRDTADLERRCDRRLQANERSRVGVSQLRHFLERLLQQRYLENVPTIVPVLEREHRAAGLKLKVGGLYSC